MPILIREENEFTWEDLPFCSEGSEGFVKSLENDNQNSHTYLQYMQYKEETIDVQLSL